VLRAWVGPVRNHFSVARVRVRLERVLGALEVDVLLQVPRRGPWTSKGATVWSFRQPAEPYLRDFLNAQQRVAFSYREVGLSRDQAPAGYNLDHNRILLGKGQAVFEAACAALRRWQMFPGEWARIEPADAPLQTGTTVAVLAHAFGLWWLNAARIVYVIEEEGPVRRFGFAYGTLPQHLEQGEERFSVEWHPDDTVWYDLLAFSRPRYWLVRLAYPLARRLQRRFARESQAAMQRAVAGAVPSDRVNEAVREGCK
jgi:uncharacterized protein (UPF0548 family)